MGNICLVLLHLYLFVFWLFLLVCKRYAIFNILAGEEDTPIGAMPGCYRLGWRHGLVEEVNMLSDFDIFFFNTRGLMSVKRFH